MEGLDKALQGFNQIVEDYATNFALWIHPEWDRNNDDDVAAARLAARIYGSLPCDKEGNVIHFKP